MTDSLRHLPNFHSLQIGLLEVTKSLRCVLFVLLGFHSVAYTDETCFIQAEDQRPVLLLFSSRRSRLLLSSAKVVFST